MRVADYKELRVYGLAFDAAMEIFETSQTWPSEERYSLTYDHICRQLSKMMSDAGSWCGSGTELREVPPEYVADPRSSAPNAPDEC